MSKPRGFSLIETLFALLTLSIGVFALAGALIYSVRAGATSARRTQAMGYADRLLQLSKFRNLPNLNPIVNAPGQRVPLDASPFQTDFTPDPLFKRNIKMVNLTTNPSDYRSELYQVDVTVFWFEKSAEHSVTLRGLHRPR